jgi:two-component system sensor histidine kinase UhpB
MEMQRKNIAVIRAAAARLVELMEAEKKRLAMELHERIGQTLTALSLNLSIIRGQVPDDPSEKIARRIDDSLKLVEEAMLNLRNIIAELRPPVLDDYGLLAALRWYGEQFALRTGIAVSVRGKEPDPRLSENAEINLFRIAQEAFNNVEKYARATQVRVTLTKRKETVRLLIADKGTGFDPSRVALPDGQRWGLLGMSERAEYLGGRCIVRSHPAKGTRVIAEVAS